MTTPSWPTKSIGDLCVRVTSGGTPSRSNPEYFEPASVPWVKTGDLRDGYITEYDECISEAGVENSSAKLLPANTVLMAMYGATVGMLGMLREPATCNQAACALIVDPELCNPRWIFYALLNSRDFIISQATGAAQQNLSGKTIRNFTFCVPSLPEQNAIAEVLGALDDKIAANTKLASTSADLARAQVASASPSVMLSEIVDYRKESVDPQKVSSSTVAHYSLPAFDSTESPEIVSPLEIKSTKFLLNQPSVLVSKLNPRFPRIWDLPRLPNIPSLASTEFLVLIPKFSSTSVLRAALSQPAFAQALEGKVAGTSGSHQRVKPADLLATPVVDPRTLSGETQESIDALAKTKHAALNQNLGLAEVRDALLPQLMSGKLRVRDAEKFVEGVL